jgi:DNA (cytosine-5)-methyltransferase 1
MDSSSDASGSPIVIDLFCGAGGLSNGLAQAGFKPILAVDFDRVAMATYRANHPNTKTMERDIARVTSAEVRQVVGKREIDLIAGGPSCQAYSTVGKRVEDDPRNYLFKHFVRLVSELQPKSFLMENVKGLLAFRNGYFRDVIEKAFSSAGYRVSSKVLCAADYGVPQRRHRIVFLGTRMGVPLSFPDPTHGEGNLWGDLSEYVTVQDAIGDLPLLGDRLNEEQWAYASAPKTAFQCYARSGSRTKYVTLHQANGMSDAAREVVRLVGEGEGVRSIDPKLLPPRFKKMRRIKDGSLRKDCTTLYHRLARYAPAYTITCYFRNVASGPFVHPLEDRSLSFREAARLMSFQDTYRFCKPMLPRQIGNAVPPLLAKALGQHILQQLNATTGFKHGQLVSG